MSNSINAYWIGVDTDECVILSDATGLIATIGINGLAVLQRGRTLLVTPVEWLQVAAYYKWLADVVAQVPMRPDLYYWHEAECQLLELAGWTSVHRASSLSHGLEEGVVIDSPDPDRLVQYA